MTRHGHFLTRKQVSVMIQAVDANDDGEIDYHEFLVRLSITDWRVVKVKIKMLVCRRILRMKSIEV